MLLFLTVIFRVNAGGYQLIALRRRQLLVLVFTRQQTSSLTDESVTVCLSFVLEILLYLHRTKI